MNTGWGRFGVESLAEQSLVSVSLLVAMCFHVIPQGLWWKSERTLQDKCGGQFGFSDLASHDFCRSSWSRVLEPSHTGIYLSRSSEDVGVCIEPSTSGAHGDQTAALCPRCTSGSPKLAQRPRRKQKLPRHQCETVAPSAVRGRCSVACRPLSKDVGRNSSS